MTKAVFPLLLLAVLVASAASAQQPVRLDFDRLSVEGETRPLDWAPYTYGAGAEVRVVDEARQGPRSLRIRMPGPSPTPHTLAQYLRPLAARGKTARLAGWIRTDSLDGTASLRVEAWADFEILVSDSAFVTATHGDWTRVEASIDVPDTTATLVVMARLDGTGTAWFDDFRLSIDGEEVTELPIARPLTGAELDWLEARTHPLRTVDATPIGGTPDLGDLAPLADVIGDARVVALGESTHGTSEFFRLKHRVLEALVREHGVRVFAIEDQQLQMEQVNAYVHGGPGTAEEAMRGMFSVWRTEEVRDLIEWMQAYNAEHPADPVAFVGFDLQVPTAPIDSLLAFTWKIEPTLAPTLDLLLGDFREAWQQTQYPQYLVADSVKHRWADGAEAAWRLVEARRTSWLRQAATAADSAAVEWAVQNARVAAQSGRQSFMDFAQRDSSMAVNIRWHLDRMGPDTRMVVWAHDQHISKGGATTTEGNYFVSSMGRFLHDAYGDDYRVLGIMAYDGSYTGIKSMYGGSRDLTEAEAVPAPVGSLEESFHQVGQRLAAPVVLFDLRDVSDEPHAAFLFEPHAFRYAGYAIEDYGFHGSVELGHQVDGILFVDRMTGTRPLGVEPWPPAP